MRPAFPTADYNTASYAAFAAMLALYERDVQGGVGQMIDLALYEPPFRITADMIGAYRSKGAIRERIGNRNPTLHPGRQLPNKRRVAGCRSPPVAMGPGVDCVRLWAVPS